MTILFGLFLFSSLVLVLFYRRNFSSTFVERRVVQTTKVYLASGKSVITMDETGNYYYVTSTTSAVDFETKTVQIGAISVRYNTYVEAVYAATLKPVLTDGGTYFVDSDNIVVSEG